MNFNKIVSLLLALTICGTSFSGCANQPAASGNTMPKGGWDETLIFAQSTNPLSLDPAYANDNESAKVIFAMYEGLLKFAKDSTDVEPCLAERWEMSDDGLTYTFYLRSGVKFHDGTDFNAEAVKFNIDRQTAPLKVASMGYADFLFGNVKSTEIVDNLTVKITLTSPNSTFLTNMAMPLGSPIVSPAAAKANNNNITLAPCGTGPYKFVRWDQDQAVLMERFDDYWGEKSKSKNLIYKIIKDNSARVVALANNEADIIDSIDPTVFAQVASSGNIVEKFPAMSTNYMAFNTQKAPFDNPEVRRAIASAINVPEMVGSLYQGNYTVAHSFLPPGISGYSEDIKYPAYDPQTAAAKLKELNISKLNILTYTNPRNYNSVGGQVLAEAVQGYLTKVGIECTIDAYDWTTFKQKTDLSEHDILFMGWSGDNGDPDNFLSLFSLGDDSMNESHYNNPVYNELIAKGIQMKNSPERYAIYTECEKILAQDVPILPLSHGISTVARRPDVEGYASHIVGHHDLSVVVETE